MALRPSSWRLAKAAVNIQLAKDAQKSGALSNDDTKAIVKQQFPDPAKAREESDKDVEAIETDKQQDRIDESQAKEMTEDRRRRSHGTTKPAPSAPRKGKRKYHLTLIMKDNEERPLVGTWVLNFGSLVEETFESRGSGVVRFEVDLDTSRDNLFEIRGNPFLPEVSFPPDAEFYYHFIVVQLAKIWLAALDDFRNWLIREAA